MHEARHHLVMHLKTGNAISLRGGTITLARGWKRSTMRRVRVWYIFVTRSMDLLQEGRVVIMPVKGAEGKVQRRLVNMGGVVCHIKVSQAISWETISSRI
jgi:hypothetical protein